MKRRTMVVAQDEGLAPLLERELEVPPERVEALLSAGAVYVDGKRMRRSLPLTPGARVTVVLEEKGREVASEVSAPRAFQVIFENERVVVVNKPAGIPSQATPGGEKGLVDHVSAYLGFGAGLVHRLDRETTGVVLFGKTSYATSHLAEQFREGKVAKRYVAVTAPGIGSGSIDWPLSKDPSRPGRWRASKQANGIPAMTTYSCEASGPTWALVSLEPETGRTHQLRAHLAALGFPIAGDKLYEGPPGPRCLLHAAELRIDGQRYEAPLPADIRAATASS
ncbi:MAG: RluA family pseudouridine synthase [Archangium sp.]|nr:RluA family pseudouridine synthase [Archangium sp.]